MPESLLNRASYISGRISMYALVPFVVSLLAFDKVIQAANAQSASISISFVLPADITTLWTVIDLPATGVAFQTPTPLFFLPVFLIVQAALTAGYLGGVRDATQNVHPQFFDSMSEYWASILGVQIIQFLVSAVLAVAILAAGFMGVLLGVPIALFVGYLLWSAPYLVVIRDCHAVEAITASVSLALDGGRYLYFSVVYVIIVAVVSLILSLFVTGTGLMGVVLGAAIIAYPSLIASTAATLVLEDVASSKARTV